MEKLQANQDDASAANTYLYQQVIGSISFATTMTRIDTAFATINLSRYLSNPLSIHLSLANRAVRYLEATKYYAQQYTGLLMSGTEAHNEGKEVLSTIYCTIDVDSTHRELPRVVCVDEKLYTPEALRPWHPVRSVLNN
jgi:hypothetical protein